ncbi:MAG: response regulator [Magnetococcales bacterium]|nr:response regulator [Magnetococcales bacterium]
MTLRILVVDDEEDAWTLMRELLKNHGRVERAANGRDAVAAFVMAAMDGDPYDLVFLDIVMPGIDGYEVVARMRGVEKQRGVDEEDRAVIIMISVLLTQDHQASAMALGATDTITKPVDRAGLYATIGRYFTLDVKPENEVSENKRKFSRPLFHSRAELTLESGLKVQGRTLDISFNGVLFKTDLVVPEIKRGIYGMIQIALGDSAQWDSSYVAFPCEVIRINQHGIALKMSVAAAKSFADTPFPVSKSVAVPRTDGKVDPGWEILGFNQTIDAGIMAQLRKKIEKMRKDGPVVVCCKQGSLPDEKLYKVVNIRHLKEIQKLAAMINDP